MLIAILLSAAININTPKALTWEVQIADQKFSTSDKEQALNNIREDFLTCDLTEAKVTKSGKGSEELHERNLVCGLQDVSYVVGIPLSCTTDQSTRQEVTVAVMLRGKMVPITLSCESTGAQ